MSRQLPYDADQRVVTWANTLMEEMRTPHTTLETKSQGLKWAMREVWHEGRMRGSSEALHFGVVIGTGLGWVTAFILWVALT